MSRRTGRGHHHYDGVPADCPLTVSQLEVLRAYARGESTKQIAQARRSSRSAVWGHASRACERLGLHQVPAAIIACQQAGWLEVTLQRRAREVPLTELQREYARAFTALIKTSPTARQRLVDGLLAKHG